MRPSFQKKSKLLIFMSTTSGTATTVYGIEVTMAYPSDSRSITSLQVMKLGSMSSILASGALSPRDAWAGDPAPDSSGSMSETDDEPDERAVSLHWKDGPETAASMVLSAQNANEFAELIVTANLNFFGKVCSWAVGESEVKPLEEATFEVAVPADCYFDERQSVYGSSIHVSVATKTANGIIDVRSAERRAAWIDTSGKFQIGVPTALRYGLVAPATLLTETQLSSVTPETTVIFGEEAP